MKHTTLHLHCSIDSLAVQYVKTVVYVYMYMYYAMSMRVWSAEICKLSLKHNDRKQTTDNYVKCTFMCTNSETYQSLMTRRSFYY